MPPVSSIIIIGNFIIGRHETPPASPDRGNAHPQYDRPPGVV
jgi:hypothetical protein